MNELAVTALHRHVSSCEPLSNRGCCPRLVTCQQCHDSTLIFETRRDEMHRNLVARGKQRNLLPEICLRAGRLAEGAAVVGLDED